MIYAITLHGRVVGMDDKPLSATSLDRHLDDVMEQLLELEEGDPAIHDPDISAKLATGEVEISVVVKAGDPEDAAAKGLGTIRCAVHAAGGYTPDWEQVPGREWALEFEASSQRRVEMAAG